MTDFDWDDAFEISAYIDVAGHYPGQWARVAADYRRRAKNCEIDVAYGEHIREKYDYFPPDGPLRGVMVFVHGGFWMKLDKSSWSHLAEGARANGWAVAMPSYVLAPDAQIADMTRQIAQAISSIQARYNGPMRLAGHSAGGHLVSRMICEDGPLPASAASRIEHVLSISGLHDLRPLLHTEKNHILGLTSAEAEAESPCLTKPVDGSRLTAWVGADERPEFIRQSRLMAKAWPGTKCVEDTGHHHFSVIDDLADPKSAIIRQLLG